jgi:hypothetical protein
VCKKGVRREVLREEGFEIKDFNETVNQKFREFGKKKKL